MADFQSDVLDKIAQVVGGAVSGQIPHFYNGGPIAGIAGCFSVAPPQVDTTPVGIVLVEDFDADPGQGLESDEDRVRLLLLVAPYRIEADLGKLTPFRDTVPAGFRAHVQLFGAPSALDAMIVKGRAGVHEWRGTPYIAWDFTIRVRRELTVTLTP